MNINKNTKIFGSFSLNAGNNGNVFFNEYFQKHNIDAIYKSFSITNIEDAVKAARCLNFGGFAVSMPFKRDVIKLVDNISDEVKEIGASNTVVNNNGKLIAYNTDYIGMIEIIKNKIESNKIFDDIYILGDGGMAAATKYAILYNNLTYKIINRNNWDIIKTLKNKIIINCTPVKNIEYDEKNIFIDTLPESEDGKYIHNILAKSQFYLYTGIKLYKL